MSNSLSNQKNTRGISMLSSTRFNNSSLSCSYSSPSSTFSPSSVSTTKYSFISLILISVCVWSTVMVMEPIECRNIELSNPTQHQSQSILTTSDDTTKDGTNKDYLHMVTVAKRSVNSNNNDNHLTHQQVRPLEACQEIISAAIARNLAKGVNSDQLEIPILKNRIQDLVNSGQLQDYDHYDDDSSSYEYDNDVVELDYNQDSTYHKLDDHNYQGIIAGGKQHSSRNGGQQQNDQERVFHFNSNNTSRQRRRHLWVKLLKQCMEIIMVDGQYKKPNFLNLNLMKYSLKTSWPREKKWLFAQLPHSKGPLDYQQQPSSAESYAKKLDFFWKDLEGIRYKKQGGKIVRINNKKKSSSPKVSNRNNNKVSKRMILLLLNLSIAKPLLEKIQSKEQLRSLENILENKHQQQDTIGDRVSKSPKSMFDNLRPSFLTNPSSSNDRLKLFRLDFLPNNLTALAETKTSTEQEESTSNEVMETQSKQQFKSVEIAVPGAYIHSMLRPEPDRYTVVPLMPSTTMTTTMITSSVPIDQSSSSSKLVKTKSPELETPRSKKLLTKEMVFRSDPWDKKGIRFKRSSNEQLNQSVVNKNRLRRDQHHFIRAFDIFGQEGIRFKKSSFDDEGIRYKKSLFDDEGIRYKKSPFDNEGIRYKKSPFDDEGIRYKKSYMFNDEGIRYKKSPLFDDEHIRY